MKKTNWILKNNKFDKIIASKLKISPLLARILSNRNITTEEDIKMILSSNICDLHDEKLLPDIDKGCKFLKERIENKCKIMVVGDYDIDGVCSSFILIDGLKKLNANVDYIIPDRIKDGYGINIDIINRCIEKKIDTIITCDNGIAASKEIQYAIENNINVIVTDHHDINKLPDGAIAIINPKRIDLEIKYPFKDICGAVVAWKFIKYLFLLYDNKIGDQKLDYLYYLDFVTLATIGDIMPLVNENHIIVKIGLENIKNTKNIGLKKLIEKGGLLDKQISVFSIGFILGPMINAAGRLKNAEIALKLFLSNDEIEADNISNELKELNEKRKSDTDKGEQKALSIIEQQFKNNKILIVYLDNVSESVAGIIAGRIKEKLNKPVIIVTDSNDNNILKASCRSIDCYNIFDALVIHNDLLLKFGGHKLAAGFSINRNNLNILIDMLNSENKLIDEDFIKKVYIDFELSFSKLNIDLINEIEKLEPFGNGFEKPLFGVKNIVYKIDNIYGNNKNVIKLSLNEKNNFKKAVLFYDSNEFIKQTENRNNLDLVYYVQVNEYNNNKTIELNIKDFR